MPNHARNLLVAQFLRDRRGLARLAAVVLGDQFKLDLLAANHQVLRIERVNRQAHAVFGVLADMRNAARGGASVGDFDGLHRLGLDLRGPQGQHGGGDTRLDGPKGVLRH